MNDLSSFTKNLTSPFVNIIRLCLKKCTVNLLNLGCRLIFSKSINFFFGTLHVTEIKFSNISAEIINLYTFYDGISNSICSIAVFKNIFIILCISVFEIFTKTSNKKSNSKRIYA